jgi:ADP-ribose pyrophosphatase
MQTPTMISERTIGKGRFLELSELTLAHPNGDISTYETISRNKKKVFGIVSVLPITLDNEIILIRQYRAPLDKIVLELPAGCAES